MNKLRNTVIGRRKLRESRFHRCNKAKCNYEATHGFIGLNASRCYIHAKDNMVYEPKKRCFKCFSYAIYIEYLPNANYQDKLGFYCANCILYGKNSLYRCRDELEKIEDKITNNTYNTILKDDVISNMFYLGCYIIMVSILLTFISLFICKVL